LVSHAGSARIFKVLLFLVAGLAIALSLATLLGRPRPVAAQESAGESDEIRIGLPAYVTTDPAGNERVLYADSSISINTICPVRRARVDPNRSPVYVNGRPVAFCCTPCPAVFSQNPERYLREMKVSLRCPVRPARRAVFDSSLRMRVNQDIFFFSSTSAMKTFRKDPLRWCGILTDPVSRERFRPTPQSPHVTFRGREYYFAADTTLVRFQAQPERFYERFAGT
jgi:YHS domain-containing protein